MTDPTRRRLSEEEYLAFLAASDVRYESIDGFLVRQEDAQSKHALIGGNIAVALHPAARQLGGFVYKSNLRLRLAPPVLPHVTHYFPDVMVSFDDSPMDALYISLPCLIVEVVSERTRTIDNVFKASDYLRIPSLHGYLLVETATRAARLYTRSGKEWAEQYAEGEGTLSIPCLNIPLSLDAIYRNVPL
ncbi:Uma2 family endonuclease [Deinococcus koreensis]|nr:Uma2 family endonuclease [Deinococcus koreensis]